MAAVTNTNAAVAAGNGLGGKTTIVTVGVGGGAISQAQMSGIVQGMQAGASLVTADATPDVFTVAGVAAFEAGVTTAAVIAVQGTGTPSVVTGDYFAAATLAITTTFE
jgi:hypothetical protein